MGKTVLMLSTLLLTQAAYALTHDECIRPRVNELSGHEMSHTCDIFLEMQREAMLAELQQYLRSSLIIGSRPAVAVSRPSSRIDNRQF